METITFKITPTANDTILKFTANNILSEGSHQYNSIDEAKDSHLAQQLFQLPFVKRVLFSANFIAIERFSIVSWKEVQDDIKELLEQFFANGGTLINASMETKKVPVEIYTEVTPNPAVLKFVCNKLLVKNGMEFKSVESTNASPLAKQLFEFPFVKEVFISDNYVSVTKIDELEWNEIAPDLRTFIREYIFNGGEILVEGVSPAIQETNNTSKNETDMDDVSKQIVQILDEYIRPAVASDGGNIAFESYEASTQIVHVILQGACSGCPSSTITLKNGIEHMLKQLIPGKISEVVAVNY